MNFIKKVLKTPELRKRIIVTFGIFLVVRFLSLIPLIGMGKDGFKFYLEGSTNTDLKGSGETILSMMNILSGSSFENLSILLMGLGPYITASIIVQMMGSVIPALEAMSREGEEGRYKMNLITKIVSVPLTFIQGYGMINLLKFNSGQGSYLSELSGWNFFFALFSAVIGSMILLWLADLITEYGIGNGTSVVIFVGIVSRVPQFFASFVQNIVDSEISASDMQNYLLFFAISVLVLLFVIVITEAERQIRVSYSKRIRGNKMYGGASTYLPIKVNQGGVIPIIFALSFVNFPGVLAGLFSDAKSEWLRDISSYIQRNFITTNSYYLFIYFILVVLFSYFYGVIALQPDKLSDNLKKQGGFIPGIRPGKSTEDFLTKVLNRITLAGSLFLGLMAILPIVIVNFTDNRSLSIGGTSIIIAVSTGIEIYRYLESQLTNYSYSSTSIK